MPASDSAASRSADPANTTPPKRTWKRRLLLLSIGLGIGLLVAEVTLRLLPLRFRPAVAYEPDVHCGARLRPNQSGWQYKEGNCRVFVNSRGLRDREHTVNKPAGVYRIAVLGDSYAEAAQVDQTETFWAVLEEQLQQCLPAGYQGIEVINFGVSGYGTAQELQMLRHYVHEYEPDLVLLAFLSANDIRNNSRALEPAKSRPFFILEDDQLVLDNSFVDDPVFQRFQNSLWVKTKDWLIFNFELCGLVYHLRHSRQDAAVQQHQELVERGLSAQVYAPPVDSDWQAAWAVTGRMIEQMHHEVRERQAAFVVMSVTSAIVVNPDPKPRETLCKELGIDDLFYPDRWIEQLGQDRGFPVVLLSEKMQQAAVAKDIYFHGFTNTKLGTGHWNQAGHAFAGKQAATIICEQVFSTLPKH